MIVSIDVLTRAGVAPGTAAKWAGPLTAATQANAITTPRRLAGFLANVLNETGNLTCLVESMDYSAAALVAQWPSHFSVANASRLGRTSAHPAYQQSIAERAYGGRGGNRPEGQGDGWLFRGHGGMQTTFRSNYVALAKAIGWSQPVELLPAYLTTIVGACDSAAIFWRQAGCNALLDAGNITAARVRVNGGTIGLAAVQARYATLCRIVGLSGSVVAAPPAITAPGTAGSDALNDAELLRVQAGQGGAKSIVRDS